MAPVPPPLRQLVLAHMLIGYRNTCSASTGIIHHYGHTQLLHTV